MCSLVAFKTGDLHVNSLHYLSYISCDFTTMNLVFGQEYPPVDVPLSSHNISSSRCIDREEKFLFGQWRELAWILVF